MHSITTALENLTRQLSQEIPATPGFAFSMRLSFKRCLRCIELAGQPVILSAILLATAQWRRRSCRSRGNHRLFIARSGATVLRQHAQPDLRIWGLNAFEPKEGYLLLPRLEWRRSGVRRPYAYICTVTFRYAMMRAGRKRFSLLWSALSLFRRYAFRSRANNTGRTKTVG